MSRPLRIEGAGFWYHMMCRGNGGRRIFNDDKDCLSFLAREERTTRERSPASGDLACLRALRMDGDSTRHRKGDGRRKRLGGDGGVGSGVNGANLRPSFGMFTGNSCAPKGQPLDSLGHPPQEQGTIMMQALKGRHKPAGQCFAPTGLVWWWYNHPGRCPIRAQIRLALLM